MTEKDKTDPGTMMRKVRYFYMILFTFSHPLENSQPLTWERIENLEKYPAVREQGTDNRQTTETHQKGPSLRREFLHLALFPEQY